MLKKLDGPKERITTNHGVGGSLIKSAATLPLLPLVLFPVEVLFPLVPVKLSTNLPVFLAVLIANLNPASVPMEY